MPSVFLVPGLNQDLTEFSVLQRAFDSRTSSTNAKHVECKSCRALTSPPALPRIDLLPGGTTYRELWRTRTREA
jgi:hypothetical protein